MQPPIPRQSAQEPREQGLHRSDNDARLSAELAAVVAGARRRALRDGDRQIDTAHLLHSLLEADSQVSEVVGHGPRTARLLGYLVQRSIGYGLRWQSSVEDSAAVPVVAGVAGFSPLAAGCVGRAHERAARGGEGRARGVHLLAAMAEDPQSRAAEVLRRAGIDPAELVSRLGAATGVCGHRPGEYATGCGDAAH
ncbi:Clp protease N-terminal domain-containing protein [Streptomyces sp. NPDC005931]|uniref:Clp protease N-terminal domain-containing protein n=1 Tax=Streptomyces sp. NPDC005931 TaxID=3364737 RepID=UPI00367C3BAC